MILVSSYARNTWVHTLTKGKKVDRFFLLLLPITVRYYYSDTSHCARRTEEALLLTPPQLCHTLTHSALTKLFRVQEENKGKLGLSAGTGEFQNLNAVVYKL